MKTQISSTVLRRIASSALKNPHLEWRHHGVGMYQAYLHEGDEEVRIHVWHPDLVLPGFNETNGIMHDHRFGFNSYVLHGAIYNEHWSGMPDLAGDWIHYGCVNAREAMSTTGKFHEPLGLVDDMRYTYTRGGQWHPEGTMYHFPPREFHFSKSRGLTVTLVVKTEVVDGYARILGKHGVPLMHAFEHGNTINREWLNKAAYALTA